MVSVYVHFIDGKTRAHNREVTYSGSPSNLVTVNVSESQTLLEKQRGVGISGPAIENRKKITMDSNGTGFHSGSCFFLSFGKLHKDLLLVDCQLSLLFP